MHPVSDSNMNLDTILLQTFRGWINGAKGSCYIRGILDNGSQLSFIKEDVSRKLNLKVLKEIDITVDVFVSRHGG